MNKPILCLDFDGVIHSYASGWQGARNIPDPPVPGALEFMLKALEDYDVVVHSSRARYFGGIWAMRRWLRKHSVVHENGHDDMGEPQEYWDDWWDRDSWGPEVTSLRDVRFVRMKPPALVTIDDRGYRFDGTWPDPKSVMAMKPWNKR